MSLPLSEHLPLIASAPNGVQKLRELILDLAVKGLLTASNTTSWPTLTLGDIGEWGSGGTPLKAHPDYYGGSIPWLVIGDLNDGLVTSADTHITEKGLANSSAKLVPPGTLLVAMYGSIGKLGISAIECATNQAIAHCKPAESLADVKYLFYFIRAIRGQLLSSGQGLAQQNISQKILKATSLNLPPLAEQHRIVAKVDELMALCDRLESEQNDSAAAHTQLVESLLATLTQSTDAVDLEANWKRIADHFDTLFTTEASINALQKSILQMAVIGKLTSQDSTDEPALDLLARICSRHKTTKAKTQNSTDLVLPCLPNSWAWSKLESLITVMDSGWSPACIPTPSPNSQTWGVLKTTAVQTLKFIESENKELPEHLTPRPDYEVAKGDILITRAGPQNRVAISCLVESTREKLMISDKIIRFHLTDDGMHDKFVALCLNAGATAAYLESAKSGMAASQMNITQEKLKAAPIPICSHNEQVRIVAKVDELMALCDSLKNQLAESRQQKSRLADTLIQTSLKAA